MNRKLLIIVAIIIIVIAGGYFTYQKIFAPHCDYASCEDIRNLALFDVAAPKPNDPVSSPIFISGSAKAGWGIFEGQAGTVRLYDDNGKELGMALLTVLGDWMQPEVQFETYLSFEGSATAEGRLVFKNDNPSGDPARDKTYEMPVKFGTYASPDKKVDRIIKLFIYNRNEDRTEGCDQDAVRPVQRSIPVSQTPIKDAVNLLLKGGLTDAEKSAGFSTEFPLAGFSLAGANLSNGVLTLQFNDPQNRSGGGSCRVGLLWASVSKTAGQFDGVTQVKFSPETLFQP